MIKHIRLFRIALSFLTPLPAGIKDEIKDAELASSMRLYPLVGLGIGLTLVFIKMVAGWMGVSDIITSTLIVLAMAALSGGIHIDGLSDMCDGFYGGRNKDDILRIMRDPHIGVMGVLGIVFILLLKWSVIASVISAPYGWRLILLTPIMSRWAMVMATAVGPYADANYPGIARTFVNNISRWDWQIAAIISVAMAALIFYAGGVVIAILVPIITIVIVLYARKVIGGVTGDVLGAINEIIEALVLFAGYLLLILG
ncbi:MAG: adenosylcobinamide-GDP ribazoletransferase [Candidatus Brocadiia bacterium]